MNPKKNVKRVVLYDDLDSNNRLISKEVTVDFPWAIILEKAAEALAVALAKRLGELTAEAIFDALLGRGGDQSFQREVITRLKIIEDKLDEVISMLQQIPELVKIKVDLSVVEADASKLSGGNTVIGDLLLDFNAAPDDRTAGDIRLVALQQLGFGESVLERGAQFFLEGIHTLSAALAAYAKIIEYDPNRYMRSLGEAARAWIPILEPFVDEENEKSFPNVIKILQKQYDEAVAAMDELKPQKEFLLAVYGPWPSLSIGAVWWTRGGGSLREQKADGTWIGGSTERERTVIGGSPSDPPLTEGLLGLPILSWWSKKVDIVFPPGTRSEPILEAVRARANMYGKRKVTHKDRIKECEAARDDILHLLEACRQLGQLT